MRSLQKTALAAVLFGLGYLAGTAHNEPIQTVRSGAADANAPSDAVTKEISTVLQSAKDILNQEGRYVPATKTLNVSAIVAEVFDAVADLETSRVDPDVCSLRRSGQRRNPSGNRHRRTRSPDLQKRVIRMCSVSRLKQMPERVRYHGETDSEPAF